MYIKQRKNKFLFLVGGEKKVEMGDQYPSCRYRQETKASTVRRVTTVTYCSFLFASQLSEIAIFVCFQLVVPIFFVLFLYYLAASK